MSGSLLNKVAGLRPVALLKKEVLAQELSYDFYKVFKNTFSYRTHRVDASVYLYFERGKMIFDTI